MVGRAGKRAVWGLDIAASAIKGVKMVADGGQVRLLAADILPYDGDSGALDAAGRDRRIWQALQKFQARHNIGSERVAVGLPGSVFFVRPFQTIQVGNRDETELVRIEIEQHMPMGLDAVLWDYELFESRTAA